jgi:hypothetical protein
MKTLTFGTIPPLEEIESALAERPFTWSITGSLEIALDYALVACKRAIYLNLSKPEGFVDVVQALLDAPDVAAMADERDRVRVGIIVSRWIRRHGNATGIADAAQSLASSMMLCLGWEWV